MIVRSEWKGDGFFEGQSESGHTMEFDAAPKVFTKIKLTYNVSGDVSHKAVEKALKQSRNICPVLRMLEKAVAIECEIVYTDGELQS